MIISVDFETNLGIYMKFTRYLVQIYILRESRKYLNSVIIRCINKPEYSKRHFSIDFKLYHDSNVSRISSQY